MNKTIGFLITGTIIFIIFINEGYANNNKCLGEMGDIKMSLLDETRFTNLHGKCWKKMDGTDITGEPLAQELPHLEGKTPDAKGRFFRVMDHSGKVDPNGGTRQVGSPQSDSIKKHKHEIKPKTYKWDRSFRGDSGIRTLVDRAHSRSTLHGATTTELEGTKETRPVNIAIFAYVNIGNPNK